MYSKSTVTSCVIFLAAFGQLSLPSSEGKDLARDEVVARLSAWESVFENTESSWVVSTNGTEQRFTLRLSPGAVSIAGGEFHVASIVDGRFVSKAKREPFWRTAASTNSSLLLKVYRQDILSALFQLGIVTGAAEMVSSRLPDASGVKVERSDGVTKASLSFDAAANGGAVLLYEWRSGETYPSSVTRRDRSGDVSWKTSLHVVRGEGKAFASGTVTFKSARTAAFKISIKPLGARPEAPSPPVGSEIFDESTNLRYKAAPLVPLSVAEMQEVVRAMENRVPMSDKSPEDAEQRRLLCGPDLISYYFHMTGRTHQLEKDILLRFPEAPIRGTNLLELKQFLTEHGVTVEAKQMTADQLRRVKGFAILSMRPAHFVLYVPSSDGLVVIDPPHSWHKLSNEELERTFTGHCLLLPKGGRD